MNLIEIGRIHSPFKQATGTPIQPSRASGVEGRVEVAPQYSAALKDLAGFDRIWLIYWFNRAAAARLTVIPYRDVVERGLFATRAPARVNPLGLSNVRLLGIDGAVLRIADVDILDDTPLLDIKPYVPAYDDFPVRHLGWIDTVPDHPVVADDRFEKKTAPPQAGQPATPS
jgi:tRNA-Thr(GGU) m(6)t(6)A37 methyltransferase TsaA